MSGVRRGTWPEFLLSDIWECLEHLFLTPWWLRVLPKELDERVEKLQISHVQYGIGSSVVHKLMDAMSSAQKLQGAGLTPHFHDERSSNVSLFELGFPRSVHLLPFVSIVPWFFFDRRYVNQGPLCGRAAALKVSSSLFLGYPFSFSALVDLDYD